LLLSIRHWTPRGREIGTMRDDRLPEQPKERNSLRWEYQTKRDEKLFDISWLQDDGRRTHFRTTWQRDLAVWRARYKVRMEAIE
jgi:hypothetical protein